MGDPAGIGPEIILKTLMSDQARKAAQMVVIGQPEPFERDAALLNLDIELKVISSPREAVGHAKNVLPIIVPESQGPLNLSYGVVDPSCGAAAAEAIKLSAALALDGEIDAVVTAPINKESLNLAGYHYPGHTEFYQFLTGAPDISMLLTLGDFRVIHVVTHTAISDVPGLITSKRIIRVASLMHEAITMLGIDRPHLAMCGLNPHAGEAGMFGREEIEEIIPAAERLREDGIDITDPLPPDTVFARAYCGEFDGVVAMFHDQGHIALKLAGFCFTKGSRDVGGVNSTLGLPIIRTSVDHGTAFDIAGQGIASPTSMIDAVELAAQFAAGRGWKSL